MPDEGVVIVDNFTALPGDITLETNGGTVTVSGTGYTKYRWYVDNILREMGSSINLNSYAKGKHTLGVTVYKNDIPYSAETSFTVQ
jgi:hypothetical protein